MQEVYLALFCIKGETGFLVLYFSVWAEHQPQLRRASLLLTCFWAPRTVLLLALHMTVHALIYRRLIQDGCSAGPGWLQCRSSHMVVPTAFRVELHSSQRPAATLTHLRNPRPQAWDLPQPGAPAHAGAGGALKRVIVLTSSGCSEERARPSGGWGSTSGSAEAGGAPPVNMPWITTCRWHGTAAFSTDYSLLSVG